jgi:hypothetical protein
MGLLALSALILMGSGFILMKSNLGSLKPGSNKIEEVFTQLEQAITYKQTDLAPLGEINIELLSANDLKGVAKSKVSGIETGVIGTLFEEAGIAYAVKKYGSSDFKAMIVAKDKNHSYRFLFKSNEIEIVIDSQALGVFFKKEKELKGIRTGATLAHLMDHPSQGVSLFIQSKEMVLYPKDIFKDSKQMSKRAFVVLNQSISMEEQATILAITMMLFWIEKWKL